MLTLKYCKTDEACFISHIDLLRHVSRIARRGGVPIKRSQGFNPHALVFFSPPCVLGLSSEAEYISIDTDIDKAQLLSRFNAAAPNGLRATNAYLYCKNPNLQANIVAADYVFDISFDAVRSCFDSDKIIVEFSKNGQMIASNVKDKIFAVGSENGKLKLRLAASNVSLRPDRLLPFINAAAKSDLKITDVKKTAQYVRAANGDFSSVDNYLAALENALPQT